MGRTTNATNRVARAEIAALVVILLAAAFLRLHNLDHAPPGLTHDEADHGRDAARVLEGIRPIYFTVGYGREPLYDYATSLVMLAVGPTYYASRLTAVFFGLLLLPLTWAWARRTLGVGVGLWSAAFLAVDFWPVMVSRQALRSVTLPALLAAAVYFGARRLILDVRSAHADRSSRACAAAGGVLLGATFYTYLAARVTWFIFPALAVYLALFRRDLLRRAWQSILLILAIAAVVGAPLFVWLLAHPGAETRIGDLSYSLNQAAAGNVALLLAHVAEALGMFTLRGDPLWMYNLPGRPLLGPILGVLFVAGVVLALVGAARGQPAPAFLLIWLTVGMIPNVVTGADAATTRAVGLMPAAYALPAWALVRLNERLRRSFPNAPDFWRAITAVAVALVALTGAMTYQSYFDQWTPARDVRVAYHHTLVETARALEASADASPVMLSSITPEAPHDPAVVRMTLRRDDLALRWFDAQRALLFPDEARVRAAFPEVARLHPALEPYFTGAALIDRLELRPDDFNRVVEFYEWSPRAALEAALPALSTAMTPVIDPGAPLAAPTLALLGYTVLPPDTLVTFWRALATYGPEETDGVVLFVHVMDAAGQIVAQEDRLDAPAWTWRPGDAFAQVHVVPGVDLRAHRVYLGAYDRDARTRLTIAIGEASGHRALLGPLDTAQGISYSQR